jgi:hypothetical protein
VSVVVFILCVVIAFLIGYAVRASRDPIEFDQWSKGFHEAKKLQQGLSEIEKRMYESIVELQDKHAARILNVMASNFAIVPEAEGEILDLLKVRAALDMYIKAEAQKRSTDGGTK